MYWTTTKFFSKSLHAIIAKEDIIVYNYYKQNLIDGQLLPIYKEGSDCNYAINLQLNNIVLNPMLSNSNWLFSKYIIKEGYWSFDDKWTAKKSMSWYENARVMHPPFDIVLAECTIPKGTKYYINGKGEVISETLIINKIL